MASTGSTASYCWARRRPWWISPGWPCWARRFRCSPWRSCAVSWRRAEPRHRGNALSLHAGERGEERLVLIGHGIPAVDGGGTVGGAAAVVRDLVRIGERAPEHVGEVTGAVRPVIGK